MMIGAYISSLPLQGQRTAFMPQGNGVRPQHNRYQQMGAPRGQGMMPSGAFATTMHGRPGNARGRFTNARSGQGQAPAGQQHRAAAGARPAGASARGPRAASYSATAALPAGGRPQAAASTATAPAAEQDASETKPAGSVALDMKQLSEANPDEQKQLLGEYLFPLIYKEQSELAGKITGMLLEIDNAEIVHMLESPDSLKAKIDEAVEVLKAHQQTPAKE